MVVVCGIPACRNCVNTVNRMKALGIEHEYVDLTKDPEMYAKVKSLGYAVAPVVIVDDDNHWCGFDPKKISELKVEPKKPKLLVVYTSTSSGNCRAFVRKLGYDNTLDITEEYKTPKEPFILVTGTYSDKDGEGALHPNVERLIEDPEAVSNMMGVVASGNTNFQGNFGLSGRIVSEKCKVPYLLNIELQGSPKDVQTVSTLINKFNGDTASD